MPRRSNQPNSRRGVPWLRVMLIVYLLVGGFFLWRELLSRTPQAQAQPAPQVAHSSKTNSLPSQPTPKPAPESPPRNPVISVKPLESSNQEPQPVQTQPASTPTSEPSLPIQPKPNPKPQTPNPEPSLSYVPESDPTLPSPSALANPTPNTRVKISGQPDGLILRRAPANPADKTIALTFDDGPSPSFTPQVLEILSGYQIKATFFWLGRELQNYPDTAQAVIAEGHSVGNHSWTHRTAQTSELQAEQELEATQQKLEQMGGVGRIFRPPGGRLNNGLSDWALRHGYTVVMWSAQSNDWEPAVSSEEIVQNVLGAAQPGSIVLLHDGGGNRSRTVAALPQIIDGLKARGYRFVTIPEMLETRPVQQ